MVLFSSDKEIIFKITNAVLLIWLVAAIAVAFSSVIRLVVKEPVREYTYEEFKITNCSYFKDDVELTEEEQDQRCLLEFNNQKFSNENNDYYKYITLYTSIANVLIVGGVLYFINRPKKEKIA
jgi:hypothetical protein